MPRRVFCPSHIVLALAVLTVTAAVAKEPSDDPRLLIRPLPGVQADGTVLLPNQWMGSCWFSFSALAIQPCLPSGEPDGARKAAADSANASLLSRNERRP